MFRKTSWNQRCLSEVQERSRSRKTDYQESKSSAQKCILVIFFPAAPFGYCFNLKSKGTQCNFNLLWRKRWKPKQCGWPSPSLANFPSWLCRLSLKWWLCDTLLLGLFWELTPKDHLIFLPTLIVPNLWDVEVQNFCFMDHQFSLRDLIVLFSWERSGCHLGETQNGSHPMCNYYHTNQDVF